MSVQRERMVEAIRTRPGMYVGDTGALGLFHLHEFVFQALLEAGTPPRDDLRVTFERGRVSIETSAVLDAVAAIDCLDSGSVPITRDPWWQLLTVSVLSSAFSLEVQSTAGWWSWAGAKGERVPNREPRDARTRAR